MKAGHPDAAGLVAHEWSMANDANVNVQRALGDLGAELGAFAIARLGYRRALALKPLDRRTLEKLGGALRELGRADDAGLVADMLRSFDRDLAWVLENQHRERAVEQFEEERRPAWGERRMWRFMLRTLVLLGMLTAAYAYEHSGKIVSVLGAIGAVGGAVALYWHFTDRKAAEEERRRVESLDPLLVEIRNCLKDGTHPLIDAPIHAAAFEAPFVAASP